MGRKTLNSAIPIIKYVTTGYSEDNESAKEWDFEPFVRSWIFFYRFLGKDSPPAIFVFERTYLDYGNKRELLYTKSRSLYEKTIFGLYRERY